MTQVQFTNKFNLPPEVVNAIMKDRYTTEGEEEYDLSVTTLISPIQQTALCSRHKGNLAVRDVMDNFWSFLGSIAHQILEEGWHKDMGSIVEQRLYYTCEGIKIGGKFDCYGQGEIRDYKTTKVYKVMKGDFKEWEKQLNIYAFFCDKNNLPVSSIKVIAILLDWSLYEKRPNYPPAPIQIIQLPLWRSERTEAYIKDRVLKLLKASTIDDLSLAYTYPCSREEMWSDVKDHIIAKKGRKNAVKVFSDYNMALTEYQNNYQHDKKYSVITRYKERKRCFRYCPASNTCQQHKMLCQQEGVKEEEEQEDLLF